MNSSEIPRNEPPQARAGLTWQWRREDLVSDYPASSWTLKYWFKQLAAAGANFSIQASADGDNFAVSVAASTTAAYTAGKYAWAAEVSGGTSEVYEVDRGTFIILPRYDQASSLDDRGHARKMLDAIEALLESRATVDQMEYTIGSRSLKKMPVKDLMEWRGLYRAEIAFADMAERTSNKRGGNRLSFKL